ncbi:MAG: lysyl-tRNA synthetase, partial [Clostridiales bacterium]|nr:lysyl-tRNA synthetase [Clostridiales bacterium]
NIRVAGRILSIRKMGRISFLTIGDIKGKLQLALKEDSVGKEKYDFFNSHFDIGDFIGVEGSIFTTKTGEKTVRVEEYTFLGKCLKVLPEKWHGLSDVESRYRQRYLDLIMSSEARQQFLIKSDIERNIRRYLENTGFMEVETPVLQTKPSGALAKPFMSHHEALDIDVYMRIAPETYLKRLVVGGFTKVFEFARCFRNEGISPTHLQDFTMVECYAAYCNYKDNMVYTRNMLLDVLIKVFGTTKLIIAGTEIDFSADWKVVSFRELILQDIGLDIDNYSNSKILLSAIDEKGIRLEHDNLQALSIGNLIDQLYKKISRPKIVNPTFLVEHPIELSPSARANDANPHITDRFQLVINGAEIINGYSELVDSIEQRKRLEQQALYNAKGDEEAMVKDDDYITDMEYGMPPISGWGMGIERLVQVLTNCENIKDCVLFPLLRPLEQNSD